MSDEDFGEKVHRWEGAMESLLVEMMNDKTTEGIPYVVDVMPLVSAFNHLIADMKIVRS